MFSLVSGPLVVTTEYIMGVGSFVPSSRLQWVTMNEFGGASLYFAL
jgi:hypothetical protein